VKYQKFYFVLISLLLVTLSVSACTAGSSAKSDFPTGKFTSASDKFIRYEFNEDNTWAYVDAGMISADGSYDVKGNQWIENGTEECPFPGTYEWSFDGTNLSFKLVGEDKCEARKAATDGQTFVLVK